MAGFLGITGLIFVVIGLRGLIQPAKSVAVFSVGLHGADALSQMRATAGGVTIACGAVQIAAVVVPALVLPALVLVMAVLGGLFIGRLYSLAADGKPSGIVWISGGFEVFGLAQAVFWLTQQ